MIQLQKNDWITDPSVQIFSKITNDQSDHYYHSHDFFEIFYILEGSIMHYYNETYESLKTGDMCLLRPGDKHSFIRKDNISCSHRDIIISENFFTKACYFINPTLYTTIMTRQQPLKAYINQNTIMSLENTFSKLIFAPINTGLNNKVTIANILSIQLLDIFIQTFQTNTNYMPAWLNSLIPYFSIPKYMREGVEFIIKDINYDKSYLCRTFKEYLGCTMTEFLREQRIEYAASLLISTDKTISQICEEIGFQSIPYFFDSFKHKYSITPKQFKFHYHNQKIDSQNNK